MLVSLANPLVGRASAVRGINSSLAATIALMVTSPKEGGQSNKTNS